MRFRRRRRGPRPTWMPNLGSEPTGSGGLDYPAWRGYKFDVFPTSAADYRTVAMLDLTWDFPVEEEVVAGQGIPSLADWQASAWRLRRIVGRFDLAIWNTQQDPSSSAYLVCLAFEVIKVDETDGGPLRPPLDYDPLTVGGVRDPWIFRRTWLIGSIPTQDITAGSPGWPLLSTSGFAPPMVTMPSVNTFGSGPYGGVIDQKTNRRIGTEERLYAVISVHSLEDGNDPHNYPNTEVSFTLDYRLVGNVMKETNRRNASR